MSCNTCDMAYLRTYLLEHYLFVDNIKRHTTTDKKTAEYVFARMMKKKTNVCGKIDNLQHTIKNKHVSISNQQTKAERIQQSIVLLEEDTETLNNNIIQNNRKVTSLTRKIRQLRNIMRKQNTSSA